MLQSRLGPQLVKDEPGHHRPLSARLDADGKALPGASSRRPSVNSFQSPKTGKSLLDRLEPSSGDASATPAAYHAKQAHSPQPEQRPSQSSYSSEIGVGHSSIMSKFSDSAVRKPRGSPASEAAVDEFLRGIEVDMENPPSEDVNAPDTVPEFFKNGQSLLPPHIVSRSEKAPDMEGASPIAVQDPSMRNNILRAIFQNAQRRPNVQQSQVEGEQFKSASDGLVTFGIYQGLLQELEKAKEDMNRLPPKDSAQLTSTSYLPTPPTSGESALDKLHYVPSSSNAGKDAFNTGVHPATYRAHEGTLSPDSSFPSLNSDEPPRKRTRPNGWGAESETYDRDASGRGRRFSLASDATHDAFSGERTPVSPRSPERERTFIKQKESWKPPVRDSGYRNVTNSSRPTGTSPSQSPIRSLRQSRWGPPLPQGKDVEHRDDVTSSRYSRWDRPARRSPSPRYGSESASKVRSRFGGRFAHYNSPSRSPGRQTRSLSRSPSPVPTPHRLPRSGDIRHMWSGNRYAESSPFSYKPSFEQTPQRYELPSRTVPIRKNGAVLQSNATQIVKSEPVEETLNNVVAVKEATNSEVEVGHAQEDDMDIADSDEGDKPPSQKVPPRPAPAVDQKTASDGAQAILEAPRNPTENEEKEKSSPSLHTPSTNLREPSPDEILDLTPRPLLINKKPVLFDDQKIVLDGIDPGLWLVQPGSNAACVLETHIQLVGEPASLVLQLFCLVLKDVQKCFEILEVEKRNVKKVIERVVGCSNQWPQLGSLIFQVRNPDERKTMRRTWLPKQLPSDGPVEITGELHQGDNILRFIQLRPMQDRVFVLHALPQEQRPLDSLDRFLASRSGSQHSLPAS